MDRIIKAILASEVPVIAWVAPEGARAGIGGHLRHPGRRRGRHGTEHEHRCRLGGRQRAARTCPRRWPRRSPTTRWRASGRWPMQHGRNADWAESAVREAAASTRPRRSPWSRRSSTSWRPTSTTLLAAIDTGERADGRAYTFNGEPLPQLSRPDDPRPRDEPRPGVPPPAERPEHRVPAVHHRLLRDPRRAVPSELLLGHPRRIAIVVALIGSERAAAQRWRPAARARSASACWRSRLVVASYGLLTVGGIVAIVLGAFALWTGVRRRGSSRSTSASARGSSSSSPRSASLYAWVLVRALMQMRRHGRRREPTGGGTGRRRRRRPRPLIAPTGIAYAGGESWSARSRNAEIGREPRCAWSGSRGLS